MNFHSLSRIEQKLWSNMYQEKKETLFQQHGHQMELYEVAKQQAYRHIKWLRFKNKWNRFLK